MFKHKARNILKYTVGLVFLIPMSLILMFGLLLIYFGYFIEYTVGMDVGEVKDLLDSFKECLYYLWLPQKEVKK